MAVPVNCTVLTNMGHVDARHVKAERRSEPLARLPNLVLSLRMPTSVNQVPEDVLRDIFVYSVPPESQLFLQNNWIHFGPERMLVLTHVCSRWRQIVLSMPYLWSTICVSEYNIRYS
jgi:hypothetical protein